MIRIVQHGLLLALLFAVGGAWAADRSCARTEARTEYSGPLIDAMAQIEGGMARSVLAAFDGSGVAHMALFPRLHRRRSGEQEVLSLKERFPQRVLLGTPKPFDQRGDLTDRFVDQTLAYLRDERYRFVGEIMFAHADKSHGEQTAEGERYVAPDGRNVLRLIAGLSQQFRTRA